MENKSQNRVLAASAPRISIPAECGPLERCGAAEDPSGPPEDPFCGCWQSRGHLYAGCCSGIRPPPRPSSPAPASWFHSLPSGQTSICPPGPHVPVQPPSSLAAGWAECQNQAGPLASELAGSLGSQRPRQVLKSCMERRAQEEENQRKCVGIGRIHHFLLIPSSDPPFLTLAQFSNSLFHQSSAAFFRMTRLCPASRTSCSP